VIVDSLWLCRVLAPRGLAIQLNSREFATSQDRSQNGSATLPVISACPWAPCTTLRHNLDANVSPHTQSEGFFPCLIYVASRSNLLGKILYSHLACMLVNLNSLHSYLTTQTATLESNSIRNNASFVLQRQWRIRAH
jgi:hypothetical protein